MGTSDANWHDQTPAAAENSGMDLTLEQQFDIVRMNNIIDATSDIAELRKIAKSLLEAWQTQRAATNWAISQQTGWVPNGLRNSPIDQ